MILSDRSFFLYGCLFEGIIPPRDISCFESTFGFGDGTVGCLDDALNYEGVYFVYNWECIYILIVDSQIREFLLVCFLKDVFWIGSIIGIIY